MEEELSTARPATRATRASGSTASGMVSARAMIPMEIWLTGILSFPLRILIPYNDSKKISGGFHQDKHGGEGTEYYANGAVMYHGYWCDDKWNGYGTYYTEDAKLIYRGYYKDNHPHGKGVGKTS